MWAVLQCARRWLQGLQEIKLHKTGRCVCLVQGSKRSLVANIGASSHFSLDFVQSSAELQTLYTESSIVYIEGFFITNRLPICLHLVERLQNELDKLLAFNLSAVYMCENYTDDIEYMAEKADIVFANAREYEALGRLRYGVETAEECAMKLFELSRAKFLKNVPTEETIIDRRGLKRFGKLLVVTQDSDHVILIWGKTKCIMDIVAVPFLNAEDIVDTTGAGDAFVGGFLHAFLKGRSPSTAARFGCRTAAAVIGHLGAGPPNKPPPSLEDFQDEVSGELTG